jgi:O-antigen/teichoic acid export membrane protein
MSSIWRERSFAAGNSIRPAGGEVVRALLPLAVAVIVWRARGPLDAGVLVIGLGLGELAYFAMVRSSLTDNGQVLDVAAFKGFARSAFLSSLAQPLNQRLDQLLLLTILPLEDIGLYACGVSLSLAIGAAGVGIAQAIYPTLTRSRRSATEIRRMGVKFAALTFCAIAPIALAAMLFTNELIRVAFGDNFLSAVPATRVLIIGAVITAVNLVLQQTLLAIGSPSTASRAQLIGLASQVILLVPLGAAFGITGAASGSLASYSIRLVCTVVGLARAEPNKHQPFQVLTESDGTS